MRKHAIRTVALAAALAGALSLTAMACSSDDTTSSTDTTAKSSDSSTESTVIGNVLPPVVLNADDTSTTVKAGTTVTFDLGDPGEGRFVAESSDPSVFKVEGEGKTEGTYTTNAGGVAVASGTAEVTVQFFGSTNGVGSPTTFTITVE
jgi:hypothetical protein